MTRKMKDSGIEWIGEIPRRWTKNKLKNFFHFNKGRNAAQYTKEYVKENGKFPVFSGQTENNGILGFLDSYEYDIDECLFVTTVGAKVMTIKKLTGKFSLSQNCLIIQRKDEINLGFTYYFLSSLFDFEKSRIPSHMQPSLRIEDLNSYLLVLPEKSEQENIATFLDKQTSLIDTIIEDTKQSIEELKRYKQSLITETITKGLNKNVEMKDSGIDSFSYIPSDWKIIPLKRLFSTNKGLSITKENLQNKGIPVINYGEIHSKYGFEFNPEIHKVYSVDEGYEIDNQKALLKAGDFIFADTSEDIEGAGNFTYFSGNKPTFAGYHTVVLKPFKKINSRFFAYLFESLSYRTQIRDQVQGIKVYSITQKILKGTKVIIPTEEEQNKIIAYLDERISKINKMISYKEKLIPEYEDYKKSMIYEYVTGKKEVI